MKPPIRTEDEATAAKLHAFLIDACRRFDYEVISAPVRSMRERTEFILKHL
jgi:hypothetical protein